MKYRVGVPEKVTKDGRDYRVWKVSEQAGFYLADGIEGEDAEELIDRIIASCSALAVKMDAELCEDTKKTEDADDKAQASDKKDVTGKADAIDKKAANGAEETKKPDKDSVSKSAGTVQKKEKKKTVYLLRKRNDERIVIDKDVFRLGKDAACVDYCISDNPTISRNHADIVRKKDSFYVKDKGSLNHTFVDGRKLEPNKLKRLESGSLVQLADEVFEFKQE